MASERARKIEKCCNLFTFFCLFFSRLLAHPSVLNSSFLVFTYKEIDYYSSD